MRQAYRLREAHVGAHLRLEDSLVDGVKLQAPIRHSLAHALRRTDEVISSVAERDESDARPASSARRLAVGRRPLASQQHLCIGQTNGRQGCTQLRSRAHKASLCVT